MAVIEPAAKEFALGAVTDVAGAVLSTTSVSESDPVLLRPSMIVAVSVCEPSAAEVVFHGESIGAPSSA